MYKITLIRFNDQFAIKENIPGTFHSLQLAKDIGWMLIGRENEQGREARVNITEI